MLKSVLLLSHSLEFNGALIWCTHTWPNLLDVPSYAILSEKYFLCGKNIENSASR